MQGVTEVYIFSVSSCKKVLPEETAVPKWYLLLKLLSCWQARQRSKRVTRTTEPSQNAIALQAPHIQ